MNEEQNFQIVNARFFKSTLHSVLYRIILNICGGWGKLSSPERKLVW